MTYSLPNPWDGDRAAPAALPELAQLSPVYVPRTFLGMVFKAPGQPLSRWPGLVIGPLGQQLDAKTFWLELVADPTYWEHAL